MIILNQVQGNSCFSFFNSQPIEIFKKLFPYMWLLLYYIIMSRMLEKKKSTPLFIEDLAKLLHHKIPHSAIIYWVPTWYQHRAGCWGIAIRCANPKCKHFTAINAFDPHINILGYVQYLPTSKMERLKLGLKKGVEFEYRPLL